MTIHRFYVLSDSRYDRDDYVHIRYAGWTVKTPSQRLKNHLYAANNPKHHDWHAHRCRWMRKVIADGGEIRVHLIYEFDDIVYPTIRWQDIETWLITSLKEEGCDLTNETNGGEGFIGYVPTLKARAHISASLRGKKQTSEHIANAAKARTGLKRSDEVRQRQSAALSGKRQTPDHVANSVKARIGLKWTPEQRAQRSSDMTGRVLPPEWTANIVAGLTGKRHSPERRGNNVKAQQRNSRLSSDIVRNIRNTATGSHGEIKQFAKQFGVCRATILNVLSNERWHDQNYVPLKDWRKRSIP